MRQHSGMVYRTPPLPAFVFHPLIAASLAVLHVYLAAGHLLNLFSGSIHWTDIWKGFGALAGAYVFAALASRGFARKAGIGKQMSTSDTKSLRVSLVCLVFFGLVAAVPQLRAADPPADPEDFDAYKIKFDAFWFYTQPTGSFTGTGGNGNFNFQKDVVVPVLLDFLRRR